MDSKIVVQLKSQKSIPRAAMSILENQFFAYLSTVEADSNPHITTMFYVWDEARFRIYMITEENSRKARNIRINNRVAVTVDERDPNSPAGNCGVLIRGRANLVGIEEVGDVIMNKYWSKYLAFLGTAFPMGSRIVIEVVPRVLHSWKGIHFFRWINPDYEKPLYKFSQVVSSISDSSTLQR
ncbi:MAG: pyridoxamine 5'-phosphate oxidase family protein [Candidatus Thorarchaeota archaeon]